MLQTTEEVQSDLQASPVSNITKSFSLNPANTNRLEPTQPRWGGRKGEEWNGERSDTTNTYTK